LTLLLCFTRAAVNALGWVIKKNAACWRRFVSGLKPIIHTR
jgi:hypothetical protein